MACCSKSSFCQYDPPIAPRPQRSRFAKPNIHITAFILVKFMYSEKAAKIFKIFPLLLTYVTPVKSKVKISKKFCGLLRIYELYVVVLLCVHK